MENSQNKNNSVLRGIKESVTVKLSVIVVLSMILLLLTAMISSIVEDRKKRRHKVINEIQGKCGGPQQINGPILTVHALYLDSSANPPKKSTKIVRVLPEELNVNGEVVPEIRKRSLYEVAVYNSNFKLNGHFDPIRYIPKENFQGIQKAYLSANMSDLRGVNDKVIYTFDGKQLKFQSGFLNNDDGEVDLTGFISHEEVNWNKSLDFDLELHLRGSDEVSFVPLGENTQVNLSSPWPDPGFDGHFLPNKTTITKSGFKANWRINSLNRPGPQAWIGSIEWSKFNSQAFGVKMLSPANDYQKITRLVKYAILSISLTFLTFFLLEIIKKWRIHPFQYILVGLALTLFYILLVALSEHLGFNISYAICTLVVVALIGFYSASVFKQIKWSVVLSFLMIGVYSFLFVTLQLEDYALLIGSIGLVFMLAATMYLTRNINWYAVSADKNVLEPSPNEPETGAF